MSGKFWFVLFPLFKSEIFWFFFFQKLSSKFSKKNFFWKFTVHEPFLGFWFRVIYGITFHPAVVLRPEHDFLFKSASTYCGVKQYIVWNTAGVYDIYLNSNLLKLYNWGLRSWSKYFFQTCLTLLYFSFFQVCIPCENELETFRIETHPHQIF